MNAHRRQNNMNNEIICTISMTNIKVGIKIRVLNRVSTLCMRHDQWTEIIVNK